MLIFSANLSHPLVFLIHIFFLLLLVLLLPILNFAGYLRVLSGFIVN